VADANIIGIYGRQPVQLRMDQAKRQKGEEILRQILKCLGFERQSRMRPALTRSRTRTLRSQDSLMDGATYCCIT
jgi:hypothetical protein